MINSKQIFLKGSILILFSIFLSGCSSTNGIKATRRQPLQTTAVFGKLKLGSDWLKNKKISIVFNRKYDVDLDDSGYFYLNLPVGGNYISTLKYADYSH